MQEPFQQGSGCVIQRCYPYGKRKAVNFTYDDGVLQDVRLVQLLNRYGLKGTFNLNSELMEREFEWIHESGMVVKRLSPPAVRYLYAGHEVASHTQTHPYMHDKSEAEIMQELSGDKRRLEELLGREVAGFAVPFDYYDEQIAGCVRASGFEYGRMSEESGCYDPWQKRYFWRAGIFHLSPGLDHYVDGFLHSKEELALCQIVGHSYDLDAENLWDRMETIFRQIADDEDTLPMTHIELVRYLEAMKKAVITDCTIYNQSDRTLWFRVGEQVHMLAPGEYISGG